MKPSPRRARPKVTKEKIAKAARRSAHTRVAGGPKKERKQPPR